VSNDFASKVGVITGAGRGVGFAIAEELVLRGASVCITGRDESDLMAASRRIDPENSGRVLVAVGSVDDESHQAGTIERVMSQFGRLDFLVNNVGINPWYGPMMDIDLSVVRKVLEANVVSMIAWTQLGWRASFRDNGGSVLNISSIGGIRVGAPVGAYNVSKAAVIHLTRQLAQELAPLVRVNCIAPALIKTEFSRMLWEGREDKLQTRYPLNRLGEPEDIAKAAAFLLSQDASWITGETLTVDGGVTTKS
jgi:NAD(P)-dependent dehydrogenase (short-subunit alcohol dehydrogenase family)